MITLIKPLKIFFKVFIILHITSFFVYGYNLSVFEEHWNNYKNYIEIGDGKNALQEFNEINRLRLINSIEDFKPYTTLLIKEGDKFLENRDYKRAYESYMRGKILSPNFSLPYFCIANLYWTKNKFDIINITNEIFEGIKIHIKNPLNKLMLLSNISSVIIISLIISYIILTILIYIKHSKSFLHDLKDLLSKRIPGEITIFIIIFVSLVPIILGKGVITLAILWIITLGFYLKRSNFIVLVILSIIILFITPIFISGALSPLLINKGIYGAIIRTNMGELNNEDRNRLIEFVKNNPNDEKALFSIALINRRLGYIEESKDIYENLLNINPNLHLHRVYNNIGNISYLTGDIDNSITNYKKALEISPNSAIPHFNLGLALRSNMLILEAERELKKAREFNPVLIDYYLKYNIQIDEKIPVKRLISIETIRDNIPKDMWDNNIGSKAILNTTLISLIFLSYAILIGSLRRKFESSTVCIKCGNIICNRCKKVIKDSKLCPQCFNLYKGDKLAEKMVDYKRKEIMLYQRMNKIRNNVISFLIPGGGHILRGYSIKGFVILFLFSSLLVEILLWNINITMNIALFIMLSIIYIYSILSFLKIKG